MVRAGGPGNLPRSIDPELQDDAVRAACCQAERQSDQERPKGLFRPDLEKQQQKCRQDRESGGPEVFLEGERPLTILPRDVIEAGCHAQQQREVEEIELLGEHSIRVGSGQRNDSFHGARAAVNGIRAPGGPIKCRNGTLERKTE